MRRTEEPKNHSSLNRRNGRLSHPLSELLYPHEIIKLPEIDGPRIIPNFTELYKDGLSLNDIAKATGKPRNTIRAQLLREGVAMRPKLSGPIRKKRGAQGKGNVRPFFGFCYFQGHVFPDQKEYEHLLLIHRLWKQEQNPNSIANALNEKKIPARSAKLWNRNSVVLILNRFQTGLIVIKGNKYELR